jgi:hypothetical protein
MKGNQAREPRPNHTGKGRSGLPETLHLMKYEKRIATVSAKVEPSLSRYLKENGGSTLIRSLILQALTGETETL